jgi:hypothetical protein
MAGVWKVFGLGLLEHARRLFVEPYVHTFLPRWSLWATGTVVPVVELVAGGLLLLEPLYEFHTHVIPRLALLVFVLMFPRDDDRFSMDAWFSRRHGAPTTA